MLYISKKFVFKCVVLSCYRPIVKGHAEKLLFAKWHLDNSSWFRISDYGLLVLGTSFTKTGRLIFCAVNCTALQGRK